MQKGIINWDDFSLLKFQAILGSLSESAVDLTTKI